MNRDTLVESGDRMVAYMRWVNTHDPGTRAALRRGLGRPPEDIANFHAHAIVARYLPEKPDRATERAFYTVAALMAAQPRGARDQETEAQAENDGAGSEAAESDREEAPSQPETPTATSPEGHSAQQPRRTLGQTLAWAVENGHLKGDTVQGRLHLLARYRTERLHRELPKLIAHLRASSVPVAWGLLLKDLALWDRERARVAKQWVQQYHRTRDQLQRRRSKQDPTATADHSESETA